MAFSIELLDRMARITARTEGGLVIPTTFATRAYASATPREYGPIDTVLWEHYSDQVLAMQAFVPPDQVRVMREDRRVRVQTSLVLWTPTLFDEAIQPGIADEGVLFEGIGAPNPFVTLSGMQVYFTEIGDPGGVPLRTAKGTPVYFSVEGDGHTTPAYVGAVAGTRWRVVSISGGELAPEYLFQVRRIPPR